MSSKSSLKRMEEKYFSQDTYMNLELKVAKEIWRMVSLFTCTTGYKK
jgi:hypothetical protein